MKKNPTLICFGLFLVLNLQAQTYFGKSNILAESISGPRSMVTCDIDGDGNLDILSALYNDGKVVWSKNTDGNGHFSAPQVISDIALEVVTVYAADIDGDGDLDVISGTTVYLSWYENLDGEGTFGERNNLPGTHIYYITSVYASDMDNDGDMDILTTSSEWDQVSWHENLDGKGNFSVERIISSSADGAKCVYADDLDGDGDMDVLSSSGIDTRVTRYLNNGDGTFSSFDLATSVGGVSSIHTCDIDGDLDKDVIIPSTNSGGKIFVYKNNGSGLFTVSQTLSTTLHFPNSVHSADFDSDGDIDLVSSSSNDNNIIWFENTDRNGTFGTQQLISDNALGANSISSGDVDGDGYADIISASSTDNKIAWYKNTDGAGNFGTQQVISSMAYGAYDIFSSDLDGDGDKDILSASTYDDKIAWYENMDGQGNFRAQDTITTMADGARSVFAADIDGDGDQDVLSASPSDDKIAWYENTDGKGTFGVQQIISIDANGPYSVHSCDIDGDGDMDVLSASVNDNKIAWFENTDGAGTFGPLQIISGVASYANYVSSADIDGDGDIDVLAAPYYQDKIIWYENTDGKGNFTEREITGVTEGPRSIFAADIDNDSDLDILSASDYDDKVAWYTNDNGAGTFSSQKVITTTADGASSVYAADIDGDGDMDAIYASEVDGKITWYENYESAGQYMFKYKLDIAADLNGACAVIADDFNGDGDVDVAAVGFSDNKVVWFKNHTLKITTQPINSNFSCNSTASFTVLAENVDVYKWQENDGSGFIDLSNNANYSGVAGPTLQIINANSSINGYEYRCVLSNKAGSKNTDVVTLTINDIEKPVITSAHNNQSLYANSNCEAVLPDYTSSATATDNCDIDIEFSQSPLPGTVISGTTNTITLTATDDLGNTDVVTFNVQVIDNTNPVISSVHSDQTIDANGNCEATLPDYTADVVATDNCGGNLIITQSPIAGTTISGTTNSITLTATDLAGNTDKVTFNVQVIDNTSPVISSVHTDRTLEADVNCGASLPDYTAEVVASDNCSPELEITQSPLAGAPIFGPINSITLTVKDYDGNSTQVTFNVAVIDNTSPVILSIHSDQTLESNGNCEASLPNYIADVVATDNCSPDLTIAQSPIAGTTISGSTNIITLIVIDDAGNTDEVTFNVQVIDNTDPVISSIHNDQTLVANIDCEAKLPNYTADVVASDNCSSDLTITQSPTAKTTISGSTNIITLTATDLAGNSTQVTFNVQVIDNTDPVISSVHNDQTLEANGNCEATLPDYTSDVVASDNCGSNLTITQSPIAGTKISGTTNSITLIATDAAGNSTQVTFNVAVIDNTNPVISSIHSDQAIDANEACMATVPDYTTDVVATDNCSSNLSISQSPIAGTTIKGIINKITLTVTDDAGNSTEAIFNVQVIDNTKPVISSIHSDETIKANENCVALLPDYTADVIASDNCSPDLTITQSPKAKTTISGTTNKITLTVTDDAGNSAEATFNVEVVDYTNPVISSTHNDQTIDAAENCEAALPDYTADVVATDNCDANLKVTQSPVAGTMISGITNAVTLTAMDDAGNSSAVSFNVEVADNTAPVIISTYNDQVIDADANMEAALPDYSTSMEVADNCDSDLDITQSPKAGTIVSGSNNTVTLTVSDDDGNSVEVSFNVGVADLSPPVITSTHNDVIVEDGGNCEAKLTDFTGNVIATDIVDSDLDITQSPEAGTIISGYTNKVTLTVADDAGNFSEVSFNASVMDTEDPAIVCVEDQSVNLTDNSDFYIISGTEFDPVSATDNCAIASLANSFNEAQTLDGAKIPVGTTNIVWTVTDESGNSANCSFDITVKGVSGIRETGEGPITVYPNPTDGEIYINALGEKILNVKVFDLTGKILIEKKNLLSGKLDLSQLNSGIYELSIILENTNYVTRIVRK